MKDAKGAVKIMEELISLLNDDESKFEPVFGSYFVGSHGYVCETIQCDLKDAPLTYCSGCAIAGMLYAKARVFDDVPVWLSPGDTRISRGSVYIRDALKDYFTERELYRMEYDFEHGWGDWCPVMARERMKQIAQRVVDLNGEYPSLKGNLI